MHEPTGYRSRRGTPTRQGPGQRDRARSRTRPRTCAAACPRSPGPTRSSSSTARARDETAEVAAEHGATVVQFHFNGTYPKKKNWALDNLPFRNDWVLIVDADEVVVPELAEEIARRTAADEADGFYLN